ncbi:UbiX family flavin prenyltransferase [Biomaibacter acetigenes]|jgi:4-hydroxy-3-polyprenylbenzoate decarboxylase|uniref:Flavin prenyltransferase UbiX n=1 Tax=Biomaibacter acetigenes TaxID=2316383 RepID=A0A3G2R7D2_9FIRM|nr:UbiX family flavin prenyltransferase [Biomaibacter acetigenes]AYO31319.1 UbiX family flavin prenyltransferase [Biomaibacter acetigenes]MDN5311245.1 flavin prenyltransferase [Thermoanaerobacteraceae bacterium]RKL61566.1 UbiX family flavin prenyltransferase [Thermoanaerobacteraceae bacterium SP2]
MRLIVAITGASGAIFGIRILEELKKKNVETHLIVSKWGGFTIEEETGYKVAEVEKMASFCHDVNDLSDVVASGSFKTDGMIVAPCSMKTLAGIACGYSDDLIIRAADVCIKERRKLLLMVRETPLSSIHLENMLKLSRLGVIIMPPVPAFYTKPVTVDDIVNQTVAKALDYFGVETEHLKCWQGLKNKISD